MSFVLKVYKDRTDDEPIRVFPVRLEEADKIHDDWKNQGYFVGLYPQIECGPSCPFRSDLVPS